MLNATSSKAQKPDARAENRAVQTVENTEEVRLTQTVASQCFDVVHLDKWLDVYHLVSLSRFLLEGGSVWGNTLRFTARKQSSPRRARKLSKSTPWAYPKGIQATASPHHSRRI
jgi:hypothetical protein